MLSDGGMPFRWAKNAKPKFVVRLSTIDVGVKRAMSHGRWGINTVEL